MRLHVIKPNKIKHKRPSKVRIDTKLGTFSFSRIAAEMMALDGMEGIVIYQDEDNPKDWYMLPTPQRTADSHRLRRANQDILFSNVNTARKIAASLTINEERFSMLIGPRDETTSMFPIITASAKK